MKNLQQGHGLPISVNDILISPFGQDLIFTKLRFAKINPNENFQIYSTIVCFVKKLQKYVFFVDKLQYRGMFILSIYYLE